jgi:uncharacterized cupin superfamily protein
MPMSLPSPQIVSFASPVAEEHSAPDPARLIAGHPVLTTRNHYADPTGRFYSGVWASTEGKWRVSYSEHEFCSLLAGRVRLVSDTGAVAEFGAGDSFVIPAGFTGTWETLAACRKLYAVFLPSAPASARARPAARKRRSASKRKPVRPRR